MEIRPLNPLPASLFAPILPVVLGAAHEVESVTDPQLTPFTYITKVVPIRTTAIWFHAYVVTPTDEVKIVLEAVIKG